MDETLNSHMIFKLYLNYNLTRNTSRTTRQYLRDNIYNLCIFQEIQIIYSKLSGLIIINLVTRIKMEKQGQHIHWRQVKT
jgi:hypothetical protein